jgi:hypothetical protein
VGATVWLAWRWVNYDEMSNLRETRASEPTRYHYRMVAPLRDSEILQNEMATQRRNGTAKSVTDKLSNPDPGAAKKLPMKKNKMITPHISLAQSARVLMSVGIVFVLTVVMLVIGSKTLGEGVITILYLIPIGWCTIRWGQLAGVSAAMTAALSFDYLFIPPYGTFHIGSLEGWLLLFLFIGMAILVVGRIQSILTEERERERKATFLFEVVAAISSQATREGVARAIADQIQEKFQAEGVQVQLTGGWRYPSFTSYGGQRQAIASRGKPNRVLTIESGAVQIGEIDIWQGTNLLPSEDDPMLQTMQKQIAAALDRVRVMEGKASYPQQKPSFPDGSSLQASHS